LTLLSWLTRLVADNPLGQVNRLASHPALPLLVTAHEDKSIRIFDILTGQCAIIITNPSSFLARSMHLLHAGSFGLRDVHLYRSSRILARVRQSRLFYPILGFDQHSILHSRDPESSRKGSRRRFRRRVPPRPAIHGQLGCRWCGQAVYVGILMRIDAE